jgi:hypothetical protein
MVQLSTCTKEHVLEAQGLGFQVEPGRDVAAEDNRRAWPYGQ